MSEPRDSGAVFARPSWQSRFRMWLLGHREDSKRSLHELLRTPLNTLLTILVIAVAVALPTGLQVLLKNSEQVAGSFQGSSQITLYLKLDLPEAKGYQLTQELMRDNDIASATFQTREESLLEFKTLSGFGDALDYLEDNPLPAVITVQPTQLASTPEAAEKLLKRLRALPEVEEAQLDLAWLRRLYALMSVGERIATALAIGLGLAVILIIGNTIRLAIENRRAEIEVIKLVGATDSFIRRPFMYSGLWFGMLGGLTATILVTATIWWLDDPVRELAGLYQSSYQVKGLGFTDSLRVLLFATLLGLGGSIVSVNRHLKDIEPR